ncbi:MAG: DAK2 domain-containing protein [Chloroflexi bacterium]|nr:DAK2 domain-containing protein [Chloroflexota bacterium]
MQSDCITGQQFREMMAAGTAWLEKSAADVDAINVFPVPDGDTGTNMSLTMRSAVEEAYRAQDDTIDSIAKAMAHGALMGARGNSGVILSQIFRGISRSFQNRETSCGEDIALALRNGAEDAYKGLARPVEGTMLTVIRDASNSASAASDHGGGVATVMQAAVEGARESVAKTPSLLPALREAGVVDAGGQGLFIIFEGALHYLKGETEQMQYRKPSLVQSAVPLAMSMETLSSENEEPYGYCTEFMIEGDQLKPDKVKRRLMKKGQSLVVVGDNKAVRVHIHTLDPSAVLRYGLSQGTLHQLKINNMDDQHKEFMRLHRQRTGASPEIGIVAVVSGEGFTNVFRSLGAAATVRGGQTMNPSVRDILKAIGEVAADKIIILPNNKNILQAAKQVPELTSKQVRIVPTESLPQGVAALLSFNFEQDVDRNAESMAEAASTVRTIEITQAVRSTKVDGLKVRKGAFIGLVDDKMVTTGNALDTTLQESLAKADVDSAELVTLYYGSDVTEEQAKEMAATLSVVHPKVQFEVVNGGQPHYYYIAAVE